MKESKRKFKELITSSFYGVAIGDALGVPVEFSSRSKLDNKPIVHMEGDRAYKQEKGTFSDDTSLTLATAIGLCNKSNKQDYLYNIAYEFANWLFNGKYAVKKNVFDVGNTTRQAITEFVLYNNSVVSSSEPSYYSNGNGSLMRMLPIAFYMYSKDEFESFDRRKNFVSEISSLTHKHIISKICCVIYCEVALDIIIQQINNTFSISNLTDTIKIAIERVYHSYCLSMDTEEYMSELNDIFHYHFLNFTRDEIKSTGYVIDTLVSVLWCITHTTSYSEAILTAVNLGGDTDTIGSITGGLAGLMYDFNDIPKDWFEDLRGKKIINKVVSKFTKKIKSSKKNIKITTKESN